MMCIYYVCYFFIALFIACVDFLGGLIGALFGV